MVRISTIRKNSWLLILLIGLGLAAFIMMDMFSGPGGPGGANTTNIGSVNGEEIGYNRFNRAEQILYQGSRGNTFGQKENLWNFFVEESILKDEGEKLGLTVSNEELMDLQFGSNLSPIIQGAFRSPNGGVDRARLDEFKNLIETKQLKESNPNAYYYWIEQENQIIKDRLQSKLAGMVSQGMYTPSWMAESLGAERNKKMDFAYVRIPFSDIDDSSVSVSDEDLNNYLSSNSSSYRSDEEQRRLEYIAFNVTPTTADSNAIRNELSELVGGFRSAVSDSAFVANNAGELNPTYVKSSTLGTIANQVANGSTGSVFGPYSEGTYFKLAKVVDAKVVPDSVKAQHILFRVDQANPNSVGPALAKADSVMTLINGGASFSELAKELSDDVSNKAKGGDLGYFAQGAMVGPFNNAVFYDAKGSEVKQVFTQFGIHLVKVNDRKFLTKETSYKMGYISRSIIPSEATQEQIENKVQEFVNDNENIADLAKLVEQDPSLTIEETPALKKNDYIVGSLGQDNASRDIVRWAFDEDTDAGDLSADFYTYSFSDPNTFATYNTRYVVAALKNVIPEGMPSLNDIKSDIMPLVMNEKKAELLSSKIGGKSMSSIASEYGTEVDSLSSISSGASFIPGLGNEPKVVAAAASLAQNAVSKPIVGENGVFIIEVTNKSDAGSAPNVAALRKEESSRVKTLTQQNLMSAMRKNADVEDNRHIFY